MEELDRDPDVKVAHLMARIRPHWDAVRTQNNLTAILERLRGPIAGGVRGARCWRPRGCAIERRTGSARGASGP